MDIPGTKQRSNANTYYWSIIGGDFCMKVPENTPTARHRVNKNNKIVWEILRTSLIGKLHDIELRESDYGPQLTIKLIPKPDHMHAITIPKKSRQFTSFMERLRGINVQEPVALMAWQMESKSGIAVHQGGQKIPSQYFTKTEDGGVQYHHGYQEWPPNFKELPERDRTNFLFDVDDFWQKEMDAWREVNAPSEDEPAQDAKTEPEDDEEIDQLPF